MLRIPLSVDGLKQIRDGLDSPCRRRALTRRSELVGRFWAKGAAAEHFSDGFNRRLKLAWAYGEFFSSLLSGFHPPGGVAIVGLGRRRILITRSRAQGAKLTGRGGTGRAGGVGPRHPHRRSSARRSRERLPLQPGPVPVEWPLPARTG